METNVVEATTCEHKLDTALAVVRLLQQDVLHERRLARLLRVDVELKDIVILDVDLEQPGHQCVHQEVSELLRERCRQLAQEVIVERTCSVRSIASSDLSGSRNHKPDASIVQHLKAIK